MAKLDPVKVKYIIDQMEIGRSTKDIAFEMNISPRWAQKLYARYCDTKKIPVLGKPGRPKKIVHDHIKQIVIDYYREYRCGAAELEIIIKLTHRIHISHNVIHSILVKNNMAANQKNKGKKKKWIRYERTHSNSLWHTDWKKLSDGRWLITYMDDASRFIVGYGIFENATTENSIKVLLECMAKYGKPATILTDRGTQFYANEAECRERGESKFEKKLVELDIRHILARVNHPQTNGKLERFHGEIERKQKWFKDIHELMHWWNNIRPHMSLNMDTLETPARAFLRKMPEKGAVVTDKQSGETYLAS